MHVLWSCSRVLKALLCLHVLLCKNHTSINFPNLWKTIDVFVAVFTNHVFCGGLSTCSGPCPLRSYVKNPRVFLRSSFWGSLSGLKSGRSFNAKLASRERVVMSSLYRSIYRWNDLSIHFSFYLSNHGPIDLSIHRSIHRSIYQSIRPPDTVVLLS